VANSIASRAAGHSVAVRHRTLLALATHFAEAGGSGLLNFFSLKHHIRYFYL
jgi:hypothetical protein